MLAIDSLHVRIGASRIINGVDLSVSAGETVGLIGPNGSGKTTLFNTISGFCNARSGKIIFKGQDVTKTSPNARAIAGIGRVFQNFGIFKEMTLEENMITAIESRETPFATFFSWSKTSRDNRKLSSEYLEQIGLVDKRHEKASSLSGGQMRLLEIQRTLAFGADLFLLDEPTAGVSPKMKEAVTAQIKKLQNLKKTVLIIEHDLNFIEGFCSRILVLDVGKIIIDDSAERVRSNEKLNEIYFGSSTKKVS